MLSSVPLIGGVNFASSGKVLALLTSISTPKPFAESSNSIISLSLWSKFKSNPESIP